MKTMLTAVLIITSTLLSGCTEKAATSKAAQESADAKARSEALKKEMETAPKVFSNRDVFKKNEQAGTAPAPAKTESK